MTTYGAYDAGLPCKNTACKSHGKPHPNCRCYGDGLAEGGAVESFCSGDNAHAPGCEYYAYQGLLKDSDPEESISGYVSNHGLHGLLKMGRNVGDGSLEKYDKSVAKGHKSLSSIVKNIFDGSDVEHVDHEKSKDDIHDWLESGGIANEMQNEIYNQNEAPKLFAEGGSVKKDSKDTGVFNDHPIGTVYPRQNMLLNGIKGRASNYLGSLMPQKNAPRMAFDDLPDQSEKKKSYRRALGIAANPMSIFKKIQKGTLEPEHVEHMNALYPELGEVFKKKLTEEIVKSQLNGKKPSYKVRQGLSLFLGTPLSSEMSPQNIAAAQATFQSSGGGNQAAGRNGVTKSKGSALKEESQSLLTANQAAASRQQKQ